MDALWYGILMIHPIFKDLEREFFKNVQKTNTCWLWTGITNRGGYGSFKGKGAHRVILQLHGKEIPKGMVVCHKCDVRNCVRPEHLVIGTPWDNVKDMYRKNRQDQNKVKTFSGAD